VHQRTSHALFRKSQDYSVPVQPRIHPSFLAEYGRDERSVPRTQLPAVEFLRSSLYPRAESTSSRIGFIESAADFLASEVPESFRKEAHVDPWIPRLIESDSGSNRPRIRELLVLVPKRFKSHEIPPVRAKYINAQQDFRMRCSKGENVSDTVTAVVIALRRHDNQAGAKPEVKRKTMKTRKYLLLLAALPASPDLLAQQQSDPNPGFIQYVQMAGGARVLTTSVTRPADTNAYAAGDVVSNSTSAAAVITFGSATFGACRAVGWSTTLISASVIVESNQATKPALELYLFSSAPTAVNDNSALALSAADAEKLVAIVPLSTTYLTNAASGASGNHVQVSDTTPIPINCARSDTKLYGLLVVRNAYTPVSAERFVVSIKLLVD
jgi:hypothetical protein